LTLKKEDLKPWVNLTKGSGPTLGGNKKDPAKGIDNEDPQASLMKMMANLYQTGDDDMKRTITESFAKAQSGQMPGEESAAAQQMPPQL